MPPVRGFRAPTLPRVDWSSSREGSSLIAGLDTETRQQARVATEAPRIPWDVFVRETFQWRAGEHVGLIGPTGQGKTTMIENILPLHPFVVIFATKPKDETMDRFISQYGYSKMERWIKLNPVDVPRRILWPDARKLNARSKQRDVFLDAFHKIYVEGGWTVALDELWVIINLLGLETEVRTYLQQARSLGISLVAATQRPAFVPLEVYDQSTHLMFWRDNDETNLRRLSGISYRSADLIRQIVSNLERFQVLYINTRTGNMARTRAPAPNER